MYSNAQEKFNALKDLINSSLEKLEITTFKNDSNSRFLLKQLQSIAVPLYQRDVKPYTDPLQGLTPGHKVPKLKDLVTTAISNSIFFKDKGMDIASLSFDKIKKLNGYDHYKQRHSELFKTIIETYYSLCDGNTRRKRNACHSKTDY